MPITRSESKGTPIVRIRFVLALMVAGLLFAAGIASAQSTTTEPLSDYTSTTPTVTTPTTTTTQTTSGQGTTSPSVQGNEQSGTAPTVAAQPAGSAPSNLAFTGAEPLLLIALGLGLAAGTGVLLVRERRRATNER
jgi:hypothetical protein